MGKGLPRSMRNAVGERAQVVRKITIPMRDVPITVDGASGVGFGNAVIGDFPQGNILFLGAVSYLQVSIVTAAGVQATFDGDYAIGTTPTADATLSGTEVNIVASAPLGAATAGVSPVARSTGVTAAIFDNTDDSLELNCGVLIDDANISANGQILKLNGYIDLAYAVLGDD